MMFFDTWLFYGIGLTVLLMSFVLWGRIQSSRVWSVVLCLALAMCFAHQILFQTIAEDSFITFRYSENWAAGNGPVFNINERVEGYSNFLWMVGLAILKRFWGFEIPIVARWIGVGCTLGGLVAVFWLTRRMSDGDISAGLLASLLVASSGSFSVYGPSGLETSLFALLIVLYFLAWSYKKWIGAGILIGLATMTRPEGVLLLLANVIYWGIDRRCRKEINATAVPILAAFFALMLPWTVWRVSYYGDWIPNTLLAKAGMDVGYQLAWGLKYLFDFASVNFPMIILGIVAILVRIGFRSKRIPQRLGQMDKLLFLNLVIYSLFIVAVGGDWMPAWRFFASLVPLIAIILVRLWNSSITLAQLHTAGRTGAMLFLIACLVLFSFSWTHPNLLVEVRLWSHQVEGLTQIGLWLHRALPSDTRVAVYANGALSYHSQLLTIDMLGLTDAHIARQGMRKSHSGTPGHIAYDYEYIVAQTPVLVFPSGEGFEASPSSRFFREEFKCCYDPVSFAFRTTFNPSERFVNVLVLREDKARLIQLLLASEFDVVLVTDTSILSP